MYVHSELPLPELGVLALVAESNDVARVAASLNVSCATIRGIAVCGAQDMLTRYWQVRQREQDFEMPSGYASLIQSVKNVVRSDIVNAIAVLTPRERLEIFEAFAYFRAFCNSPVQNLENQHGKV